MENRKGRMAGLWECCRLSSLHDPQPLWERARRSRSLCFGVKKEAAVTGLRPAHGMFSKERSLSLSAKNRRSSREKAYLPRVSIRAAQHGKASHYWVKSSKNSDAGSTHVTKR